MRTNRATLRIVAIVITLVVLAGASFFAWTVALPWSANHFGFALPGGTDGLPYRIQRGDRSYATHGVCARANWCAGQLRADVTKDTLISQGYWPLIHVGTLPTFLGVPYPVLASSKASMALYVPDGPDRYIAYTIEGGP